MEQIVIHACLVHPHPLECEAVADWLSKKSYISFVGKCTLPEQFVQLPAFKSIDMVLIFAYQTGKIARQILKIRKLHPQLKILLLLPKSSPEVIREVVRPGVSGCIGMEAELDEWERAVQAVAEGRIYYDQEIMLKLAEVTREDALTVKKDILSKREAEILRLVANAYSTNRIASELSISGKTVETHRRNLFQKLGVKNSVGLTRAAVRMGMV